MNSGSITSIVVIAAVIMSIGGVHLMSDGANGSDYTVLDSADKLAIGQVFTKTSNMTLMSSTMVYRITDIENGEISYRIEASSIMNDYGKSIQELDYFLPDSYNIFDYTDSEAIPEGVTVSQEGGVYVINGTIVDAPNTTVYESLRITYDGTEVTNAEGKITEIWSYEGDMSKAVTDYITEAGELKMKSGTESVFSDTIGVQDFLGFVVTDFSPDTVPPTLTVIESTGRFSGVTVTIYNISGTYTSGETEHTWENVNYYVYNGHILKIDGKMDGMVVSSLLTITA